MKVSVILSVFNKRSFLREAVTSLLSENLAHLEIIVVDDCSTDGSIDTVTDLPVKLIRLNENQGTAAAKNHGLKASSGELIAFLDADDVLEKNGLVVRRDWLLNHPDDSVVGGWVSRRLDRDGNKLSSDPIRLNIPSTIDLDFVKNGGQFFCGVWLFMFRRSVIEQVGFFDESLKMADDMDFMLRTMKVTHIRILPEGVVQYRIHGENMCVRLDENSAVKPKDFLKAENLLVRLTHGVSPVTLSNRC